jgi:hypothetical protein
MATESNRDKARSGEAGGRAFARFIGRFTRFEELTIGDYPETDDAT